MDFIFIYSAFRKYSTFYSLIPKWIKFIISLKILQTIPHNDKVKEICLKSLQIYKNKKMGKKKKSHAHKYSQPLLNTLLKHLWHQLQPQVFLSMMLNTSLAHLFLGSFSHSSLQDLSSSIRLDGKRRCTAIFRSLQRCSIGFKSGLWLGHSRTFTEFVP